MGQRHCDCNEAPTTPRNVLLTLGGSQTLKANVRRKREDYMNDCLNDSAYRGRQFCDLAFGSLFGILVVVLLSLIITFENSLPPLGSLILCTMVFILGIASVMYLISYRHRREHKQLHDMLLLLTERIQKGAEPESSGYGSEPRRTSS